MMRIVLSVCVAITGLGGAIAMPDSSSSTNGVAKKLEATSPQIVIDAAVVDLTLPRSPNRGANRSVHLPTAIADYFLGNDVRWFTNFVPIVGRLEGFSYVGGISNDLDTTITSLLRDGGTNVDLLQKPRIITTDGKSGYLWAGLTVPRPPYSVGSWYYPETLEPSSTGLELMVTPAIRADGLITVAIKANCTRISGKTHISGVGDVPNMRASEAQASATLRNGDVLVIGGATRNPSKRSLGRQPNSELIVLLRITVLPPSNRPGDSR